MQTPMELFSTLPLPLLWELELLPIESRRAFKAACQAAKSLTDTSITLVGIHGAVEDDDKDLLLAYLKRLPGLTKLSVDQLNLMPIVEAATQARVKSLSVDGPGLSVIHRDACAIRRACPFLTELTMINQFRSYTFITPCSLLHLAGCPLQSLALMARWSDPPACYHALGSFTLLTGIQLYVNEDDALPHLESWTALQRLETCAIHVETTRDTPDTSIVPLLQLTNLTALRVLIVSSGDGSALAPISSLSRLRTLNFGSNFHITPATLEGMRQLTCLTSLGIGSIACDNLLSPPWLLPHLQSLAVRETTPLVLHRTLRALQTSTSLLRLCNHRYLECFTLNLRCASPAAADAETDALAQATRRCPPDGPMSLCLTFGGAGCQPLSLAQLAVGLRFMPLRELALHEWRFGSNDDWAAAAVALGSLRSLELERCHANDQGLIALSQHMVNLRTLRIQCYGVSDRGWVAMAAARPEGAMLKLVVPGMSFRLIAKCVEAGHGSIMF